MIGGAPRAPPASNRVNSLQGIALPGVVVYFKVDTKIHMIVLNMAMLHHLEYNRTVLTVSKISEGLSKTSLLV